MPINPVPPIARATRIDHLLDALIPREGDEALPLAVRPNEYFARLTSLKRKLLGVSHRAEQWSLLSNQIRARFDELAASNPVSAPKPLPPGAEVTVTFTFTDARLENEFESFLFAVRSSTDVLARVISAFRKGQDGIHSINDLRKKLAVAAEPVIKPAIDAAWATWLEDLTKRRDAAGHFIGLAVRSHSRRIEHSSDDFEIETQTAVTIPKTGSKASPSVWHESPPVWGGVVHKSEAIAVGGARSEVHVLMDIEERVVLRHEGELPPLQEQIDADTYVACVCTGLQNLVEIVLSNLAAR